MDDEIIENDTGHFVVPGGADHDWVVNTIRAGRVFDQHIADWIFEFYSGGHIFDIGANFGQLSVYFHRRLRRFHADNPQAASRGRVFSFEASPFVYPYCKRNLAHNCGVEVKTVFGAVWNAVGEAVYFPIFDPSVEPTYGSYALQTVQHEGVPVATITIDALRIAERVGAMKIDAQGSDLRVLEGAFETITRWRPVICVEFEGRFMEQFGYSYSDFEYFLRFAGYRIERGGREGDREITAMDTLNLLCLPRA